MRILIVSDVQGNLTAFDAVLAAVRGERFDAVVCLGDVACGPDPVGVVARLDDLGASVVRGNMDEKLALAPRADAEAARAEIRHEASFVVGGEDRWDEIDAWAGERLGEEGRRRLGELPRTARLDLPGSRTLLACHGSPTSTLDVIGPATPVADIEAAFHGWTGDIVAIGHLHDPMQRVVRGRTIVNPGSVGWPSPGGTGRRPTRATAMVLVASRAAVDAAVVTVRYELDDLTSAVLASGMPHPQWYLRHWVQAREPGGARGLPRRS